MSQDPTATPKADLDLDEDLFNFDEATGSSDADYDLDEIFSSFEEADEERVPAPTVSPAQAPADEPAAALPAAASASTQQTMVVQAATAHAASPPVAPASLPPAVFPIPPAAPIATAAPSYFGGRGVLWTLIFIASLNALVALVVVRSTVAMRGDMAEVGREVADSTREVMQGVRTSVDKLAADPLPHVPPNPEEHPTFDVAREEIANGMFHQARQRLYALLSIVDRLDPVTRARVEARANYLLAEAVHLEAVQKLSGPSR